MGEHHALARNTIKGRRECHRVAEGTGGGPAPVVGEDEENIGSISGARETQAGEAEENPYADATNTPGAAKWMIKQAGVHKRMKSLR